MLVSKCKEKWIELRTVYQYTEKKKSKDYQSWYNVYWNIFKRFLGWPDLPSLGFQMLLSFLWKK